MKERLCADTVVKVKISLLSNVKNVGKKTQT